MASALFLLGRAEPEAVETPAGERDAEVAIRTGIRRIADESQGEIARFYRERDFAPLWTTPTALTVEGLALLRRLATAQGEGFVSRVADPFEAPRLAYVDFRGSRPPESSPVSRLEWTLSESLLEYASHLLHGSLDPDEVLPAWFLEDTKRNPGAILENAAARGVDEVLEELERSHEDATGLVRAIDVYRRIERAGGWPLVPEAEEALELGVEADEVVPLRRRLVATGDLAARSDLRRFDDGLEAAVRAFQRRHGLEPDGRVGERTLAALNVPVAERVRQLEVNLERRRWLPETFGPEHVWVNVPEYRLYAYRGGRLELTMAAIVGKPVTRTPLFSDELEYIVYHPYWNVPPSIALEELLPKHREDPGHLPGGHYEVVNRDREVVPFDELSAEKIANGALRIRRRPGPFNDLGRIKFMMPNRHNVYLHDTPSRYLFERPARAFSHGCIRLEKPMELASYVLEDRTVDPAVRAREDSPLPLERSIPVFVVYFTAFMRDGVVHFRDDVYGYDGAVRAALERMRKEAEEPVHPELVASLDRAGE